MAEILPLKLINDPLNPGKKKLAEAVDGDSLPSWIGGGAATTLQRRSIKIGTKRYITGLAPQGTATSAAGWQLYQLDLNAGAAQSVIYADGDDGFVHVWDIAEGYVYE